VTVLSLEILDQALLPWHQSIGLHALEVAELGATDHRTFHTNLPNPTSPTQLDAIITDAGAFDFDTWQDTVRRLRLRLNRHGALLVLTGPEGPGPESIESVLERFGLRLFLGWQWSADATQPFPLHAKWTSDKPSLFLLRFQRASYSPLTHARELLRAMRLGDALAVLDETSKDWYTCDEDRGMHEAERLVCLLVHDRHAGAQLRQRHLVAALNAYNSACTLVPNHAPVYQCLAAFWNGVGRPDMGRRLMETVEAILPVAPIDEPPVEPFHSPLKEVDFLYPDFDPSRPPRILFVCHPESDFGADVLFDGLRRVLGAGNVVGFPWKPTLHGQDLDQAFGYPCTFQWPDPPVPLAQLLTEIRARRFDAILYCDAHGTLPRDETRQLLEAAADTPLFLLDSWDDCGDLRASTQERDGIASVAGYFKREMVNGLDYGIHAWPLPFAFPDDRFANAPQGTDREGLFWAGKLIGGARRLQLTWLAPQVPMTCAWGAPYTQEEYADLLRRHSVGLCFFGNGFDTVRYWELPAHGAMLLAERSPLVIPNNFEDGRQAVFFDNAVDLLEKSRYYLAHPEEAASIALAGHLHAREFHAGTARARQCLGLIQARLRELAKN
jgi:hypothetical protein